MPYTIVERDGQFCVYKEDEEGHATGDPLGCHNTKEDAADQIGAIELSEQKNVDTALEVAQEIMDPWERDGALYTIAVHLAYEGQYDEARQVAALIESPIDQIYALSAIVRAILFLADTEKYSSVSFYKGTDGSTYFVGLFSNQFKDRDGHILTESAHQHYVLWVEKTGVRPPITLFHQPQAKPGFWTQIMDAHADGHLTTKQLNTILRNFYADNALGETETVWYADGFLGVIAKVYDDKINWVKNLQTYPEPLGMSHGFIVDKKDGNLIDEYRTFEMSVLPLDCAANSYTYTFYAEEKENMGLPDRIQEFLASIKQDLPDEVGNQVQSAAEKLYETGVEFKTVERDVSKDLDEAVEDLAGQLVKNETFVNAFAVRLATALKMQELDTYLRSEFASIREDLEALKTEEDAKIADLISPSWASVASPTERDDNLTEKAANEVADEESASFFNSMIWNGLSKQGG